MHVNSMMILNFNDKKMNIIYCHNTILKNQLQNPNYCFIINGVFFFTPKQLVMIDI